MSIREQHSRNRRKDDGLTVKDIGGKPTIVQEYAPILGKHTGRTVGAFGKSKHENKRVRVRN